MRRSLNFVVATFLFQANLALNGCSTSETLTAAATELLHAIKAPIIDFADTTADKDLIWRALVSLISLKKPESSTWPMMLQADTASGMRPDLLQASHYTGELREDAAASERMESVAVLGKVWRDTAVSHSCCGNNVPPTPPPRPAFLLQNQES